MPYIWVPKSQLTSTHKPNPKIDSIAQPSSSNSPKINLNNRKKRRNKRRKSRIKNKNKPNWLQLPEDVWFSIISKLNTIHIVENVQKVCRLFRKICIQPAMFRVVDMTLPDAYMFLTFDANVLTRYVVDRSDGELVDIYVEFCCDDDTLMYIVERSKKLKHLRIGHYIPISDEALVDAVRSLPMLDELEIIISPFCTETYEALGHACPSLKSFSLNSVGTRRRRRDHYINNEDALAISKTMPNLRRLQLIGNTMTNEGLKAILDGCPLLESLDLRTCFNINLSGDMGKRCAMIKHLRRPNDSTSDYSHQACQDYDPLDDCCFGDMQPWYDYDYGEWGEYEPDYDSDTYQDLFNDFDEFLDFSFFAGGGLVDSDSDSDLLYDLVG